MTLSIEYSGTDDVLCMNNERLLHFYKYNPRVLEAFLAKNASDNY